MMIAVMIAVVDGEVATAPGQGEAARIGGGGPRGLVRDPRTETETGIGTEIGTGTGAEMGAPRNTPDPAPKTVAVAVVTIPINVVHALMHVGIPTHEPGLFEAVRIAEHLLTWDRVWAGWGGASDVKNGWPAPNEHSWGRGGAR